MDVNEIIRLRHYLHSLAELSGQEKQTAKKIKQELALLPSVQIIENIGGYGVAGVLNSGKPGKTFLFRAELDALPIEEHLETDYVSGNSKVSHKCGHDGHMAILLGLGRMLVANRELWKGKVVLMFQPAEETGTGAYLVVNDEKYKMLKPDLVFALHNLPGYPLHSIITRTGLFTSSSQGLIINLSGRTSHAGHPEQGNSPLLAMLNILTCLNTIKDQVIGYDRSALVTIINLQLGEQAFGTNPGQGKIMVTLRAHCQQDLNLLKTAITDKVINLAEVYKLEVVLDWVEYFPGVYNHKTWVDRVKQTAGQLNLKIIIPEKPFPWTEDFAHFTQETPGVMLGLGAGEDFFPLHDQNYDFPDSLIETGIDLWWKFILQESQLSRE